MGLIDSIKNDVKKSGQNKSKFAYFREGVKQRVRFLVDMDDGMEVKFHDSFEAGVNVPCQEIFGRDCEYCEDKSLRTRSQYIWSVYNYEVNEVQLFMFPVNNCTPVPALMAMYENYGTLTDRDFVISFSGKMQNKTYQVVPMDKNKFRNEKAKPFSEKAILKMLDKAFPSDSNNNNDDDEWEDDENEGNGKYDDMTPLELFKLCKKKGVEAKSKKTSKYYINLLEEYDNAQEDWDDDDDDDDEWEEE